MYRSENLTFLFLSQSSIKTILQNMVKPNSMIRRSDENLSYLHLRLERVLTSDQICIHYSQNIPARTINLEFRNNLEARYQTFAAGLAVPILTMYHYTKLFLRISQKEEIWSELMSPSVQKLAERYSIYSICCTAFLLPYRNLQKSPILIVTMK